MRIVLALVLPAALCAACGGSSSEDGPLPVEDAALDAGHDTSALDTAKDSARDDGDVVGDSASVDSTSVDSAFDGGTDGLVDAPDEGEVADTIDAVPDVPLDAAGRDAFVSAWAHAICDDYDGCCTAVGKTEDHAKCLADASSYLAGYLDPALAKGSVVDESKVPACADALRAGIGECADESLDDNAAFWRKQLACTQPVMGTAAPGEKCRSALDCIQVPGSQTTCLTFTGPSGTSETICQRRTPVAIGESCENGDLPIEHRCDPTKDLVCDFTTKKCLARPAAGAKCLTSFYPQCDAVDRCDATSTCVPRLDVGATCASSGDCKPGARCDLGSKTCVVLSKLGDPCGYTSDCASGSCTSGHCALHISLFPGTASLSCK